MFSRTGFFPGEVLQDGGDEVDAIILPNLSGDGHLAMIDKL